MLIKKANFKKTIFTVVTSIIILMALTGVFKAYHDSDYVKGEYARICPQNYGDPISLDRCYWSYKFEGNTLETALKTETAALFIVPALLFLMSMI